MKIDLSVKGVLQSLMYFAVGAYAWIQSIGLDAYVITALAILIALDMTLGWVKAAVVPELENPTSKRAKKGILTKMVMFAIPVVVGLIWGALHDKETALKVVNVQLTGLMLAEGYSVIGNVYAIYTGEVMSEFDAITFIIKKTGDGIKKLIDKIIE